MYYDLISSLPLLPYFQRADRLPITPLRLDQRLRILSPTHAQQLSHVRPIVSLRSQRFERRSDEELVKGLLKYRQVPLDKCLREYLKFRLTQRWMIAALRCRQSGSSLPSELVNAEVGLSSRRIQQRWEAPGFGLEYVHRWLPEMAHFLAKDDLLGLERLLVKLNWVWLTRCADQDMFQFSAVFAYVFKWDMLRAWLQHDPIKAKAKFTQLVNEITNVESS
ncbi:DUF2764 family protein [bacterium]|nr:DUF2764 family protein [bacterium]